MPASFGSFLAGQEKNIAAPSSKRPPVYATGGCFVSYGKLSDFNQTVGRISSQ
jgi:hypothetical protein